MPDVFDQDDEASVVVVEDHPGADLMTDVDAAVSGCPAAAIVLRTEG